MGIDTSDYYPKTPGYSCDEPGFGNMEPETGNRELETGNPEPESPQPVSRPSKDPETPVWERGADRVANILSWVLVPLLMPLYALIICFHISVLQFTSPSTKWVFCLIIAGITCVLPMLVIYALKLMGLVQDVGLNGRKERLIPYLVSMLSLAGAGWFMLVKGAPLWTGMFFFGGALAGLVNMVVNLWWKISAHAAAIAGVVALLVCISREALPHPHIEIWVASVIGLAGLLGAARVWLGRHTVLQVLAGSAVGFLCVFFLTLI